MTKRSIRQRRLLAGAVAVATAATALSVTSTSASWVDREWDHAVIGTVDCENPGMLDITTRGEGRMLSGTALGVDLDTLATVPGVVVTNDAGSVAYSPADAAAVPGLESAYADPLRVGLLNDAIGVGLSGLLQLPLATDAGVYGQFAQAAMTDVAGASGTLTDAGAINTSGDAANYPNIATLDLYGLVSQVNPGVAASLSQVAGLRLEVGSVAGRSHLNACEYLWSGDALANVHRDYLAAGADLVIDSPTVGALVTGVTNTIDGVQDAVDGLTYGVLKPLLETGITGIITSGLGLGVSLADIEVTSAEVSIDLSSVTALLSGTIHDDAEVLSIDLASGEIRVNTAALLAKAYEHDPSKLPTGQLNGLDPNTDLLGDEDVLLTLNGALESALSGWLGSVNSALDAAVANIAVDIEAVVQLRVTVVLLVLPVTIPLSTLSIGVSGTLDALDVSVQRLDDDGIFAIAQYLLDPILALVSDLVSALTNGLGSVVRGIILDADGLVRELPTTVTGLTGPILQTVSNINNQLFLSGIVQVLINAQNAPLAGTNTVPPDLLTLEASQPGRFDVAAIRVGVLGALETNDVRVYLGRGSAAP